jgi:hypothetical protein
MAIDSPGIAHAYLSGRDRGRRDRRQGRRPAAFWLAAAAACLLALGASAVLAEDTAAPADFQSLDGQIGTLKQEVVDLNRDLFLLEEELLFPANTQVAVFVSMDVGTFFALDSVQIAVDGKEVTNYLYTEREADALLRGGVHRVWLGNLKAGKHELTAFFTGVGPHGRDYKRGATLQIEKGVGAKYVELKISDRVQKLQPEFLVREWD